MIEMSDEFAEAYGQVQGHVIELHGRWNLFRKLYRGNEESHPILAATGSQMFWLIGRLLQRGTFPLFRQLTDPRRTAGRANASLRGLLCAIAGPKAEAAHPDLIALLPDDNVTELIRTHANKYASHLDLDLLSGHTDAPEAVAIEQMEQALTAIDSYMNELGRRFFRSAPVPYRERAEIITSQAERLVHLLRLGLAHENNDAV
jgi:hypothetical protein